MTLRPSRWTWLLALCAVTTLAGVWLTFVKAGWLPATQTHRLSEIRPAPEGRFASEVRGPWSGFRFREEWMQVSEDGRTLGGKPFMWKSADAAPKTIVFFSVRDGTDPRGNGRAYECVVWMEPEMWLMALALGAAALAWLALARMYFNVPGRQAEAAPFDDAKWALAIFVCALAVRAAFLWQNPAYNDGLFSVQGTPYTDARGWNRMAISMIEGHGLGFEPYWSPKRAGYPLFLAMFYTWFGDSLWVAKGLQVLIGAASAMLVFLTFRRLAPLAVAIAAALVFTLDWRQVQQAGLLTTEPLGTLFMLASLWKFIVAGNTGRARDFIWSGLLLGASNIVRPLTIVALPAFLALIVLAALVKDRQAWRIPIMRCAAFLCGVFLCLTPWLIRQRVVHGIWAISDNTATAAFAASTPEYGYWKPETDLEADRAGLPYEAKARYEYFNSRFRENLTKFPGYYWSNVRRSLVTAIKDGAFFQLPQAVDLLKGALLVATALAAIWAAWRRRSGAALMFVATGLFALAALILTPNPWLMLPAALGVVFTLRANVFGGLALLAMYGGGIAGSALFGNPALPRTRLLLEWIEGGWIFAGIAGASVAVVAALLPTSAKPVPATSPAPALPVPRWLKFAGWAAAAFVILSAGRLAAKTFIKPPETKSLILSGNSRRQLVEAFAARWPDFRAMADPALLAQTRDMTSKIFIEQGIIEKEVYWIPKGIDPGHWSIHFEPRDHDNTSLNFRPASERLRGGLISCYFAGKVPREYLGKPCVVMGLIWERKSGIYDSGPFVEAVAIVPGPKFKEIKALDRALLAPVVPLTRRLLDELQPQAKN